MISRESALERALRVALRELISLRDDTYDSCTDLLGRYTDPDDSIEVARLDRVIDDIQATLNMPPDPPKCPPPDVIHRIIKEGQ